MRRRLISNNAATVTTITPPIYSGTVDIDLPAVVSTATGVAATAFYSSVVAITLPEAIGSYTANFSAPVYSGSSSVSLSQTTFVAVGSNVGVFTATAAFALPPVTNTGSGSASVPSYSSTAITTLPNLDTSITSTFTAPIYTSATAFITPSIDSAVVSAISPPIYATSPNLTAPSIDIAGVGTRSVPVYSSTGTMQLPAIDVAAVAVGSPPVFTATVTAVLQPIIDSGTGDFSVLTHTGIGQISLPRQLLGVTGTHVSPVYTANPAIELSCVRVLVQYESPESDGSGSFSTHSYESQWESAF